ncbi:Tad domain-containing protein [uncultured Sphingomonas sp.]|uniref:Tad domain-containing protein n=1 Tax=uncultured Sphingomonas sp. TaxID=158754 RepID=UPI0035CA7DDA
MAAAIFPLAGLVGGGVDMGRMYLTKTRLQQACDAGALGGRKVMAAGTWEANGNAADAAANRFFDSNFGQGDYGTGTRTRSFAESGGTVTGTASAVVPMTIMRILGLTSKTLEVTCSAQLKLPNTDIMFVLDLSGSMARDADDVEVASGPTSRVVALRAATKCFYEVVALVNTPEDCGFTPSGGTAPGVQIRFGFVNYGSMVNVGKLLPHSALADYWTYQSRTENTRPETTTNTGNATFTSQTLSTGSFSSWSDMSNTTTSTEQRCRNSVPANGTIDGAESRNQNEQTSTSTSGNTTTNTRTWYRTLDQTRVEYRYSSWTNTTNGCKRQSRSATDGVRRNYTQVTTTTVQTVFDGWNYMPVEVNVSGLKNTGTGGYNASITLPIGNVDSGTKRASDKVIAWDGCIEERKTAVAWPFTSITSGHWDLDVDMAPTTEDWSVPADAFTGPTGSKWGPSLRGIVWARGVLPNHWYKDVYGNNTYTDSTGSSSKAVYVTPPPTPINYAAGDETSEFGAAPYLNQQQPNSYHCPAESRTLQVWPQTPPSGQLSFSNYVDTLQAGGNTFYDIGLIWGARFLSPTGLFAATNAATPSGGAIERHIVFMTDGNVQAQHYNRSSHGLPWYDRRQNGKGFIPSNNDMIAQNHARLNAICAKVKTMPSTTLWVVGFGAAVTAGDTTRLTNCASNSTRYFPARTNNDLKTSFRKIAATISQLKLTR